MASKSQFAKVITGARKERGLTVAQVAEKVGVSKSNVSYWESGRYLPTESVLGRLAAALGVAYEDLLVLGGYAQRQRLVPPEVYLRAKFPKASADELAEAKAFFEEFDKRQREGRHGKSRR